MIASADTTLRTAKCAMGTVPVTTMNVTNVTRWPMASRGCAFKWYDLWVGFYWDRKARTLYFCPLPCIVFWWVADGE